MLEDGEIEKINKLINQGKSDYKIGRELGHSANTVKKIREEYKDAKVNHTTRGETRFDDPIGEVRGILCNIDNLNKNGKLKAGERKEWEKRLEQLREMVKKEVDDRIEGERADAVKKNNEEWSITLQQHYVSKQIFSDLNNKNKELNKHNSELVSSNKNKDTNLFNIKSDLFRLVDVKQSNEKISRDQIYILSRENNDLKCENSRLQNEMKDFDYYVERQMKTLEHKTEILNVKEIKFKKDEEAQQQKFNKLVSELNENIEDIKKREKNISMREAAVDEKIKSTNDEFNKTQRRINRDQEKIDMDRADNEKNREQLKIDIQQLVKWQTLLNETGGFNKFSLQCNNCKRSMFFDAADPETYQKLIKIFGDMHPECRLKNEQPKRVILKPVSNSGEPIFQSGFSPVIQSGIETIMVNSNAETVVQSGSPIIQSGEKGKIVTSGGGPVIQSGFSDYYYSGIGNFDKNSEKRNKVSS